MTSPSPPPHPGSASAALVPASKSLRTVARAASSCEACPLFARALGTVFGEGPLGPPLMLVGEQPGDVEDRQQRVFVGPAGRVLDELIERAGLDRATLYLTNAVKHFKHQDRGKRRLHARPNAGEIAACNGWLEAEVARVRPRVIVLLGAVAVYGAFGPRVKLTASRGKVLHREGWPPVIATFHPSAALRAPEPEMGEQTRRTIVADLRRAACLAADRPLAAQAPTPRTRSTARRAP